MSINVVKRNGEKEPLNVEKIHRVVEWACENISGVSVSEVEIKSQIQFYNNIKTVDITETLIKAASELISEETPNYQYVAGRLINYHLRKEVYGQYTPDSLLSHYLRIKNIGYYDAELGELYDENEFKELNKIIDHSKDNSFTYAAMEQLRGKYLVKNRVTKEFYETPQMAMMLIAMTLFAKYEKSERLKWVKDFYRALSDFDISLPTPIMAGVRTPQRQYSSCVLIESGDSLDSINATASSIVKYASQKAGIGISAGAIRAIESPVAGGVARHTGVTPFFKYFQSAVSSCSQGGIRNGSATLYVMFWHYEIEDILVLKNNKGVEENRVRHLDYGIQFNRIMYERLLEGGNITLFSPHDVPDLYDAFYVDVEKFKELYEKYERSTKIRKRTVPAIDLFTKFMQERKDTGRIYFQNVDHSNTHGSFIPEQAPIKMSNLCVEITLPTKPINSLEDEEAEIALCILAAINWGKIKKPEDFERPCTLVVRALDALIDYQSYPVKAAEIATKNRRPIGVGIANLAFWLAKNNTNYSNPDLELIDQFAEAWSYYLIKASIDLAEQFGPCPLVEDTKYGLGIFPKDTYKKEVDEIVKPNYRYDWDALAARARRFGIRNSTLMALMPGETSSQVSNSTNGIEPPRSLVSVKASKDGSLKQVVPEIHRYKNKYELLWDQKSPEGYIKIAATLQKWIDQSISTNTSYNPIYYEDEKIPMSEMLKHLVLMYKLGLKTGYYLNTNDQAGEINIEDTQASPEEVEVESEECLSCAI